MYVVSDVKSVGADVSSKTHAPPQRTCKQEPAVTITIERGHAACAHQVVAVRIEGSLHLPSAIGTQ